MPSTHQSSKHDGREQYPDVAAEIGEDPARFLDVPLVAPDHEGSSPFALAAARIAGIDDTEVANAWLRVEAQLERGPRKGVVQRLNRQKADLETDDPTPEATAATAGGDA